MQVFKVFFKIIKSNLSQILVYFTVFLAISVLLVNQTKQNNTINFEDTKIKIALFNYDKNSNFSNGLEKFISENSDIISIENTKEKLQDALYYREVDYILTIPNGFGDSFINKKDNINLEKISSSSSYSSTYMDFILNKYLNFCKSYKDNIPNISTDQLEKLVNDDMKIQTNVNINSYGKKSESVVTSFYFTYFAYVIFAIVILGITSILLSFNNQDLKKRTLSSPLKPMKYNIQIIFGCLIFTLLAWFIICLLSILIYGIKTISNLTPLLFLNAFVISLVALSVSFLVGNFIRSRSAQSSITTILSLGLSFISGVFVPQEIMSPTVLKIASFTPTYWYVKNVNTIKSLVNINIDNLLPIIYSILIQLGFAISILAITLVILKQRKTSNN